MARLARVAVTTTVAAAALGASVLALGAPAQADPISGFAPYVGVGSDTTQDVMNAIAGDVPGVTGVATNVASYDAFGSAQITTKKGGPAFDRPAGSGAGVKALSDALTGTPYNGVDITGQVQFARSSSGPSVSGSQLTYVPFGRDAVSYAYRGTAAKIGSLTTAQLNAVYSAATPVTINGVKVIGVLPQSSSGTRKFFLSAIGVTTVGASVVQTDSPENDGSILTGPNKIVPFSAAQWIAQNNGLVTNTTSGVALGSPNGKAAVTGTTTLKPVAAFYNSAPYGRYVYNVIPTSATGTGALAKLFVGSTSTLCKASGQAIVKKFGFAAISAALPTQCGATTVVGGYTP
jgi:ABC-type phosphate transport system substrate-binding protein